MRCVGGSSACIVGGSGLSGAMSVLLSFLVVTFAFFNGGAKKSVDGLTRFFSQLAAHCSVSRLIR